MKYCSDCKDTKKDNNLCDEHYDILENENRKCNGEGRMQNIKVEQVTLYIASDTNKTDIAFDSVINTVMEDSFMSDYTLLDYDNPTEYKLVKKGIV